MKKLVSMLMALVFMMTLAISSFANDYETMINEIAEIYELEPTLIYALIEKESNFNEKAKNGNCLGLTQINPNFQKERMERLGVTDIYEPYSNILVATDFLVELIDKYGSIENALTIYNMGNKGIELVKKGKTSKYARSIVKRSEELKAERTNDEYLF